MFSPAPPPAASGQTPLPPETAGSKTIRRVGIIGGGQLARMLAVEAARLGLKVVVMERSEDCPAATAARAMEGDWNDAEQLLQLAAEVDLVTLENEFVDAACLRRLEEAGHTVLPTSATMDLVQDKYTQKRTFAEAGLRVPEMMAAGSVEEVAEAAARFGYPVVLKARRNGYDGKGNATIESEEGVAHAWRQLGGGHGRALHVEAFCPFVKELAVMVTRGRTGEICSYPVVETVQRNHVCNIVRAPAVVEAGVARRASELARRAVEAVGGVGTFGVEMFLLADGEALINEIAPRVHNSGHFTIEACGCSQFENHLRAILGWPLGDPAMVAPAAVMVNLLGVAKGGGEALNLPKALSFPGARVHLYGKGASAPGRKMGHVTALGKTLEQAEAAASGAANVIEFGFLP